MGVKLLLFCMFWMIGFYFVTGTSNSLLQTSMANMSAPFPDASDPKYSGLFNTNALGYFMDLLSSIAARLTGAAQWIQGIFGFGSITMYGQTVNIAAIALVNLGITSIAVISILAYVRGFI